MTRFLQTCVLVSLALAACHQRAEKPAPPQSKKGQNHAPETMLYVDGVPRASLSWAETPRPGPLCSVLADVGVACPTVRAVHLYALDGSVKPLGDPVGALVELEPGAVRVGGSDVRAVTVYVDKPVPALPVTGIPYLEEKVRGGTRVNVDGRLATRLKRNQIEGELDEGPNGYSLADFLAQKKLETPKAVELVGADGEVVRVPDAEIAKVTFAAEPEKHGQMSFRFAGRAVSTVAVNLYRALAPPVRVLAQAAPAPKRAGFTAGCSVVW
jgi:hypothetical protein